MKQKIAAEEHIRELLERENVPAPDWIEYGLTCIRLFWETPKVVLVVDIDRPPDTGEGGLAREPRAQATSQKQGRTTPD